MSTQEEWRPIPGWPDYDISDRGRVVSRKAKKPRELAISLNHNGYPRATLMESGGQSCRKIHQLVLLAFVGPCPEGMEVRHLDGNKLNNTLSNLAYGTRSENILDRVKHGVRNHHASKTHCHRGHLFDEANTYLYGGTRKCKACRREQNREWYAARAFRAAGIEVSA